MNNVDETYRKINRFDDLDIFSRARLMNTGEYDEYLQERELETYKQALLDIKELLEKDKKLSMFNDCREPEEEWSYILECDANPYLDIVNKALGDKENE